MKVPQWFVVGCSLLSLNLVLVLGGTVARHAIAEPPESTTADAQSLTGTQELEASEPAPKQLPEVPSLDSIPASSASAPPVLGIEDFKKVFSEAIISPEVFAPLDEVLKETPEKIPEQLSHSFFEAIKLRLQTVEHMNQTSLGLVQEAEILYQRGEVKKAQELLRMATQLREMASRLLVFQQ